MSSIQLTLPSANAGVAVLLKSIYEVIMLLLALTTDAVMLVVVIAPLAVNLPVNVPVPVADMLAPAATLPVDVIKSPAISPWFVNKLVLAL